MPEGDSEFPGATGPLNDNGSYFGTKTFCRGCYWPRATSHYGIQDVSLSRKQVPFPQNKTESGWGVVALLTVSDKAMHTNVNFLMWAAVTALVVLTSLLLGLFWGEKGTLVTGLWVVAG